MEDRIKKIEERVDELEKNFGNAIIITSEAFIIIGNLLHSILTVMGQNLNLHEWSLNQKEKLNNKKKKKDGCMQFTYCNECMLYPIGLGCPKKT